MRFELILKNTKGKIISKSGADLLPEALNKFASIVENENFHSDDLVIYFYFERALLAKHNFKVRANGSPFDAKNNWKGRCSEIQIDASKLVFMDIDIENYASLDSKVIVNSFKKIESVKIFADLHKEYKFYCFAPYTNDSFLLDKFQFVFGKTKSDVVEAVLRWRFFDINCIFEFHSDWLIRANEEFNLRNPDELSEIGKGYWRLTNLPMDFGISDLIGKQEVITDESLNFLLVEELYKDLIFDNFNEGIECAEFGVSTNLDKVIQSFVDCEDCED